MTFLSKSLFGKCENLFFSKLSTSRRCYQCSKILNRNQFRGWILKSSKIWNILEFLNMPLVCQMRDLRCISIYYSVDATVEVFVFSWNASSTLYSMNLMINHWKIKLTATNLTKGIFDRTLWLEKGHNAGIKMCDC